VPVNKKNTCTIDNVTPKYIFNITCEKIYIAHAVTVILFFFFFSKKTFSYTFINFDNIYTPTNISTLF